MKNEIKNKKNILLFLAITFVALISNNAFLQKHYYGDTIILMNIGYFQYAKDFFLADGRLFSALHCFLAGLLNLHIDLHLFLSTLIGIFLLSLSTLILYKFTIKYLNIENKLQNALVLFSVFTIIFNHMSIEYLLYAESCIMCLGLLFSILATIFYLIDTKQNYLKSFLLLLISTICYQGLINIFPILVITLKFLHSKEKNFLKLYIKDTFITGIFFAGTLIISSILLLVIGKIFNITNNRINTLNLAEIFNRLSELFIITKIVFVNQLYVLPDNFAVAMTITTLILLTISCKRKTDIIKYLLVIVNAYVFCIFPLIVYIFMSRRIFMAIGALMGISLLFVATQNNNTKNKLSAVIISIFIFGYFVFNIFNNFTNTQLYLKTFLQDEKTCIEINSLLQEYEETSKNTITKLSYIYSTNPHNHYDGIKEIMSLTEKKLYTHWTIDPTLEYYCNRKFKKVNFPEEIYNENFANKKYSEFSKEHVIFIKDTMYIYLY